MKSSRIRTFLSLVWLIFTLSLITWWFIFAIRNLNSEEVTESARHYKMLFYEGSTLLVSVMLGGIVLIFLSYRDDLRHQKVKVFFTNFSHEIKTSITRIRLQSDILIEADSIKNNKILQRLLIDISKLDLQLENSLLLSHFDEATFLNEDINFSEMIKSVQLEFDDLKIQSDQKAILSADSRALKSVLRNIFENSRRHGKASEVKISIENTDSDLLKIIIQDNGQGSARPINKIGTEILSASQNQGCGIGLYLSKQLIAKMQGQIFFHDQVGKGFQTTLRLKGRLL